MVTWNLTQSNRCYNRYSFLWFCLEDNFFPCVVLFILMTFKMSSKSYTRLKYVSANTANIEHKSYGGMKMG